MQALTNQRRNRIMAKADLTAQRLRELLSYNPETGAFTWKVANGSRAKVGAVAGTTNYHGYVLISFCGKQRPAHRMAWLYMHGEWPAQDIDHINGDRADNRISNLRCVSRSVNMQNQRKPRSNNNSGLLGVSWVASRQLWVAQINIFGKQTHLGRFRDKDEAHEAYLAAKRQLHEGCTI
jgi:hypothetical protein